MKRPLPLGRVVMTASDQASLDGNDAMAGLKRHERGDWGDVDREDARANDRALDGGGRVLSAYRDRRGTKFWVITEADRSATTILLPEDY